ncbi:hypothetical protein SAMN05661008_00246 [Alkalithermobacter thermoalcaliphilus JW-YL-7 = DSM 7308]|uniref:Uncharacterized protein n=1 Tax=Alkalithermobacter thermoalcaliphilus JW-YL-7 = DSM 7308 TaxID=1121328 RepID=A0A150FRF6_CLOPD|nr:hypothetical protein JWYL7_1276 [[Clostridium] paradoxum JW-YL-7 = DSM 7308]SHK42826.1 hypothetical protein SAMN05661008_00246 [[Clostridium] paradoxum JW-YL-7 = DSM 7308]
MNKKVIINGYNNDISTIFYEDNCIYINSKDDNNILMTGVKNYDVSIDCRGNVYIVCITDEELYYLTYFNNRWSKTVLKRLGKISLVDYIKVISVEENTHIFYTLESKLGESSKIVHLYKNNINWKIDYLKSRTLVKGENTYFIDNVENDIFVLSKLEKGDKIELSLLVYSDLKKQWSLPLNLGLTINNIKIKNFFIDSKRCIHIIYSEDGKNTYYAYKDIHECKNWKINLIEGSTDLEFKIFEINDEVIIIYKYCNSYVKIKNKHSFEKTITDIAYTQGSSDIRYIKKEFKNKFIDTYEDLINRKVHILGVNDSSQSKRGTFEKLMILTWSGNNLGNSEQTVGCIAP